MRRHGICDLRQVGGPDNGFRKPLSQVRIDLMDLFDCVRAQIVVPHFHRDGQIRLRHAHHAAILQPVVHHDDGSAAGILPDEERRHVRRRARRVDADIQQGNAVGRERRDQTACVPWNVRHFRAGCRAPEPPVERLRKPHAARNRRGIQQLALPREWQRVPRDIAPRNRLLHAPALGRTGLLQIFVEEPGPGSPYIALVPSRLSQFLGRFHCQRIMLREIAPENRRLRIHETRIEVAFEHHQHLRHAWIGRGFRLGLLCGHTARAGKRQATGKAGMKLTSVHLFNCNAPHMTRLLLLKVE